MQNRVLVTGGAGFIGSHLVELLVSMGKPVTVLDNFSTGKRTHLHLAEKKGDVRIIEGSVLDLSAIDDAMENCNLVYHMAVECVRRSLGKPLENHHTNATGTINTLEIARRSKISRFVYCSSSEVYGNAKDGILNESTLCEPMTVYGASKLAGEYYAKAYYRTYQLPVTIVRPFNAYGPHAPEQGERAEVIPRFIIRLLNDQAPIIFGNGQNSRDFTYVTEIARGLFSAAHSDKLIGREVNIAFGQTIRIDQIAKILAKLCNKEHIKPVYHDTRPGDVHFLHADTSLASQILCYKAEISIEEGLKQYVNWFKEAHPDISTLVEQESSNWQLLS